MPNLNLWQMNLPPIRVYSCSFAAAFSLFVAAGILLLSGRSATAQSKTQSVVAASSLPELPLKGWGPYARASLAPCCLIGQPLRQQFIFPLVISQQRESVLPQRVRTAGGGFQSRLTPVVLQRRAYGLSPVRGGEDDWGASGPFAALNRAAQMVDTDAEGNLWTTRIHFAPAKFAQSGIASSLGSANAALPAGAWSEGEATVECFPAFADLDGDGLLIRVTLTNSSSEKQWYGVDLLGSMDTPGRGFGSEDLQIQAIPGVNTALVLHNKSRAVFALSGPNGAYRTHCYRVSDAFFAPGGSLARRTESGAVLPDGLLAFTNPENAANSDFAPDHKEQNKQERREKARQAKEAKQQEKAAKSGKATEGAQHAGAGKNGETLLAPTDAVLPPPDKTIAAAAEGEGQYALTRLDGVEVAPGQSVTLYMSIGVGRDAETARDASQTLLRIAEGRKDGRAGSGSAYASALKAHEATRFSSGIPAIDRLMTQMFANTPNMDEQRVGVGSRLRVTSRGSLYDPARDALMAIGWNTYRPDFAAAQLNAWFQTRTDPDALSGVPLRNPRAVPPTNLFALWELFQRTHDRPLLKRYYPYARRRYQELLTAGRIKPDGWLFAWPEEARDAIFLPGSLPPGLSANSALFSAPHVGAANAPVAAPDYAAYVIASARLMATLAELTNQSAQEKSGYVQDALETNRALNAMLWDADKKVYAPRPQGDATAATVRADTLAGLLPLMAGQGAQTLEQRAFLLHQLTDPALFWSPVGLRSVSHASPNYRANEGANGAVRFGLNWLFWKILLDAGEPETARKLAANLLQGYIGAQTTTGTCPEWLNGDTGAAGGVGDLAGDAGGLLFLWAAYHQPGTLSGGWNVNILDHAYDRPRDTAHIICKRLQPNGTVNVLCVMDKPNGKYALTGAITGTQTAAADGVLTLALPQDNTTLVVDIVPKG